MTINSSPEEPSSEFIPTMAPCHLCLTSFVSKGHGLLHAVIVGCPHRHSRSSLPLQSSSIPTSSSLWLISGVRLLTTTQETTHSSPDTCQNHHAPDHINKKMKAATWSHSITDHMKHTPRRPSQQILWSLPAAHHKPPHSPDTRHPDPTCKKSTSLLAEWPHTFKIQHLGRTGATTTSQWPNPVAIYNGIKTTHLGPEHSAQCCSPTTTPKKYSHNASLIWRTQDLSTRFSYKFKVKQPNIIIPEVFIPTNVSVQHIIDHCAFSLKILNI